MRSCSLAASRLSRRHGNPPRRWLRSRRRTSSSRASPHRRGDDPLLFLRHRSGERQPRRHRPLGDRHVHARSARKIVDGQVIVHRRREHARSSIASPSRATASSSATSSRSKSSRRATPASTPPRPTPTSSASRTSIKKIGHSASSGQLPPRAAAQWPRRSSCSTSTKATRPASSKSISSATRPFRAIACSA